MRGVHRIHAKGSMWARCAGLAVIAFVSTVLPAVRSSSVAAQADQRRWLPEPVAVASFVDRDGDLFGNPLQIAALPDGGFVLTDLADYAVRAFLADGRAAWTFGRAGDGPGEFRFLQDIDVSRDGEVVVLDRRLGRATIIDGATGQLITSFRIPGGGAMQVLPSQGRGRVWLVPEAGKDSTLWMAVSGDGELVESVDMPVACGQDLIDLLCEVFATSTGGTGAAFAFRWSSKLLFANPDGSVRSVIDGIGRIQFPEVKSYEVKPPDGFEGYEGLKAIASRVDPTAVEATQGITADESHVFVLDAVSPEGPRRVVDVYEVDTGDYVGSLLFPEDLEGLAVLSDGRLATLDLDFFPTVQLWELAW